MSERDRKGTIVIVDDEPNIADLAGMYLEREGYRVLKAVTGEAGLEACRTHRPRLLVLDVGLPDIDGLEVCKRIRAQSQVPVIFLTARDSEVDRVLGLELGGDDYLTKPFSPAELVARVKAVLRRVDGATAPDIVQAGPVTVDAGRREVRLGDRAVEMTTKEFDLRSSATRSRSRPCAAWGTGSNRAGRLHPREWADASPSQSALRRDGRHLVRCARGQHGRRRRDRSSQR